MLSILTGFGGVQKICVVCLVYKSDTFRIIQLRPQINLNQGWRKEHCGTL